MPLLFCLGQHSAMSAVAAGLREGERLIAYLDDLHVVCKPDRVGAVHDLLRVHLWDKCRISLHAGKTKVWNKSGTYPPDCARLQRAATDVSPEAVVWRGDVHLHPDQQGFKVLGVPFGHSANVKRFLEEKIADHSVLLDRLTRSLRGSSCLSALQSDPISSCAPSTRRRRTNSHQPTTVVCGGVCARFCPFFQVAVQKIRPGCHYGKEALDSGERNERNPPHIGLVGRTP